MKAFLVIYGVVTCVSVCLACHFGGNFRPLFAGNAGAAFMGMVWCAFEVTR